MQEYIFESNLDGHIEYVTVKAISLYLAVQKIKTMQREGANTTFLSMQPTNLNRLQISVAI